MFSVVDDVLEARDYIAQLINKGWFRHAVGERGIKHIITLLRFVDTHYRACSVNVDLDFLINLLDEYYNTEGRVRYFIRELVRVEGVDELAKRLMGTYPMLPPDVRDFVDNVLKSLPSDAKPSDMVELIMRELTKELEDFRERLVSLVNTAKSQCPNQAYNQTS
jgi:hypothetical protein